MRFVILAAMLAASPVAADAPGIDMVREARAHADTCRDADDHRQKQAALVALNRLTTDVVLATSRDRSYFPAQQVIMLMQAECRGRVEG